MDWNDEKAQYWRYSPCKTQFSSPNYNEMDSPYYVSPLAGNRLSTDSDDLIPRVQHTPLSPALSPPARIRNSAQHKTEKSTNTSFQTSEDLDKNNSSTKKNAKKEDTSSFPRRKTYRNQQRTPNNTEVSWHRRDPRYQQQFFSPQFPSYTEFCSSRRHQCCNTCRMHHPCSNAFPYYHDFPKYLENEFSPDCCPRTSHCSEPRARKRLGYEVSKMYAPSYSRRAPLDCRDAVSYSNKCNYSASQFEEAVSKKNISAFEKEHFLARKGQSRTPRSRTFDKKLQMEESNNLETTNRVPKTLEEVVESVFGDIQLTDFDLLNSEIQEQVFIKQNKNNLDHSSAAHLRHGTLNNSNSNKKDNAHNCSMGTQRYYSEDNSNFQPLYSSVKELNVTPNTSLLNRQSTEHEGKSFDSKFEATPRNRRSSNFIKEINGMVSENGAYLERENGCRTPDGSLNTSTFIRNSHQEVPSNVSIASDTSKTNLKNNCLTTKYFKNIHSTPINTNKLVYENNLITLMGVRKELVKVSCSRGDGLDQIPCINIVPVESKISERSEEKFDNINLNEDLWGKEGFEIAASNNVIPSPSIHSSSAKQEKSNESNSKCGEIPSSEVLTYNECDIQIPCSIIDKDNQDRSLPFQITGDQDTIENSKDINTSMQLITTPKLKSQGEHTQNAINLYEVSSKENEDNNSLVHYTKRIGEGDAITFVLDQSPELAKNCNSTENQVEDVQINDSKNKEVHTEIALSTGDTVILKSSNLCSDRYINNENNEPQSEVPLQYDVLNDYGKTMEEDMDKDRSMQVYITREEINDYKCSTQALLEDNANCGDYMANFMETNGFLNRNSFENLENTNNFLPNIDDDFLSELLGSVGPQEGNIPHKYFDNDSLKGVDSTSCVDQHLIQLILNSKTTVDISVQTEEVVSKSSFLRDVMAQTDRSINPHMFNLTTSTQTENISVCIVSPTQMTPRLSPFRQFKQQQFSKSTEITPDMEFKSKSQDFNQKSNSVNFAEQPTELFTLVGLSHQKLVTPNTSDVGFCLKPTSNSAPIIKTQNSLNGSDAFLQCANIINDSKTEHKASEDFQAKINLNYGFQKHSQLLKIEQQNDSLDIGLPKAIVTPNENTRNIVFEISNQPHQLKQSPENEIQIKKNVHFSSPLAHSFIFKRHEMLDRKNELLRCRRVIIPTEKLGTMLDAEGRSYQADQGSQIKPKKNRYRAKKKSKNCSDNLSDCKSDRIEKELEESNGNVECKTENTVATPQKSQQLPTVDEQKVGERCQMAQVLEETQRHFDKTSVNMASSKWPLKIQDLPPEANDRFQHQTEDNVETSRQVEETIDSENIGNQANVGCDPKLTKMKGKLKKKNKKCLKASSIDESVNIKEESLANKCETSRSKATNNVTKQNEENFKMSGDESCKIKLDEIPRRVTRNYLQKLKTLDSA